MKRFLALPLVIVAAALVGRAAETGDETWRETRWNGERVFAATSHGIEAIVSAERARLVYFGAAGEADNLLFLPTTLHSPAGWGGHRVWLGPQTDWRKNWPPPSGWDATPPERIEIHDKRLELSMAEAGDGWPHLRRTYFWQDGKLHCVARMDGGTRPAQMIHIVQVPATAEVTLAAQPSTDVPRGFVQVHLGRGLVPVKRFPAPPHVTELSPGKLRLNFTGKMDKFGFMPQPIEANLANGAMRIARGELHGEPVSTPDEGFATQIYLGSSGGPVIELEQLSPLFPAGSEASFEIVISGQVVESK